MRETRANIDSFIQQFMLCIYKSDGSIEIFDNENISTNTHTNTHTLISNTLYLYLINTST